MSAAPSQPPKVYGWCPGALRPMASGDGLVVRIRPPLGRLSPDQTRALAQLSQEFGNGLLDISARANLQMRGIRADAHGQLITALRALGLVDDTPQAEARRNILLAPFWQDGDTSHRIAQDLGEALKSADTLDLPGKFGFAVDTGPQPVLCDTAADIRIEQNRGTVLLVADGSAWGKPVTKSTAAREALDLACWFLDHGGAADGRGRMHRLVSRRALPAAFNTPRGSSARRPPPGQSATGALVALEFGQIPAQSFAKLADHGALRLTPWRMLLVETSRDIPALPGLILDATDPRLHVVACTGAPGCLQARAATRALARDLAPNIAPGQTLHVSGCPKGCAHPKPADVTLVAQTSDTFDLIVAGTAGDPPHKTALSLRQLRQSPELLTPRNRKEGS